MKSLRDQLRNQTMVNAMYKLWDKVGVVASLRAETIGADQRHTVRQVRWNLCDETDSILR